MPITNQEVAVSESPTSAPTSTTSTTPDIAPSIQPPSSSTDTGDIEGLKMISTKLGRKFDLGNYNSLTVEVSLWYDLIPGENPQEVLAQMFALSRQEIRNQAEPIILQARRKTAKTKQQYMGADVEGDY